MPDLRIPIGLYFGLVGLILLGVGLIQPDARAALTQININLYSGLSLIVFGGVMLWLARRRS